MTSILELPPGVPPIVQGRFGLEQRCAYRHPDLYDEEVPEMDFETAVSRPDLGTGCAVRSFLLLGDQNAGKSTMLHSFCRDGDPGFLQLSSLLPVLSSSFINTRLVPRSLLGDKVDPNRALSAVRDELPFMDTDIGRGCVLLTLENFAFFCHEFGIWGQEKEASEGPWRFSQDVRFVALHFLELGGDHLDRLQRFVSGGEDLESMRRAEESNGLEADAAFSDDAFWADMHEVLLGSLRLLRETNRTVYFVNCLVMFSGARLHRDAFRAMLRKLRFLDFCLGSAGGAEVLFYCSRAAAIDTSSFDAAVAWDEACSELAALATEFPEAVAAESALRSAPPDLNWVAESQDKGLDLTALEEVAGAEAAAAWRRSEARSGLLLAFVRSLLVRVMPVVTPRLRLLGVHAVRNFVDEGLQSNFGPLCAASVVQNVARLLQNDLSASRAPALLPHVAELILRCAAGLRRVDASTIQGCWITCGDLAEHLEECEAQQDAVPIPEATALAVFPEAGAALAAAGVCMVMADGNEALPRLCLDLLLELPGSEHRICVRPAAVEDAGREEAAVLFVTREGGTNSIAKPGRGISALALPLDSELFALLSSEAAIRAVARHLGSAPEGTEAICFHFLAPEVRCQLRSIRQRLLQELGSLVEKVLVWAAVANSDSKDLARRLLHLASDVWQACELLSDDPLVAAEDLVVRIPLSVEAVPPALKKPRSEAAPADGAMEVLQSVSETLVQRLLATEAADKPSPFAAEVLPLDFSRENSRREGSWPRLQLRLALHCP